MENKKANKKKISLKKAKARIGIGAIKTGSNIALAVISGKARLKLSACIYNISYDKHKLNKLNLFFPISLTNNQIPLKIKGKSTQSIIDDLNNNYDKEIYSKQKTLIYFHGGAFCGGDKKYHGRFCQKMADNGYIVVNVNYRLLPKFYITDCYDDCFNATEYALEHFKFINPKNIYFAGDSAGASISAYIAARHASGEKKFNGKINIRALGLFYGVYDFIKTKGIINKYLKNVFSYQYGEEGNIKELSAIYSPINYITENFPPSFIASGDADGLHNQSVLLVKKLKELKTNHSAMLFENRKDGFHGFLLVTATKAHKESFAALLKFFEEN